MIGNSSRGHGGCTIISSSDSGSSENGIKLAKEAKETIEGA
jgi:hypothetical protein